MSKKCTHPHSAATEDTYEHQHSDTHEPSLIGAHKLKKPKHFTVTHTHRHSGRRAGHSCALLMSAALTDG